jgi:predicted 3-demethylubiquinone-9 3-methyltransferase (glyoxalase superfamily)
MEAHKWNAYARSRVVPLCYRDARLATDDRPMGKIDERNCTSEINKQENDMQKITPFLWFNDKAEEAANFYVSIFKNSKIRAISRFGEGGPAPKGTVMTVTFQLDGQEFFALNGGPLFTFTEAISLFVNCETQQEVDELWDKLSAGGEKSRCGWLKDKYGLSWQIIPSVLSEMLQDNKAGNSKKAFEAMFKMDKIDIKTLQEAYNQK